jgi:hypothetical protein
MEASDKLHAPAGLPRRKKLRYSLDRSLSEPYGRSDAMQKRKMRLKKIDEE